MARRLALAGCLPAALAFAAVAGAVPGTGFIFTIAGTGSAGYGGDGGPATAAQLSVPVNVSATPDGGYLIVEQGTNHIRRVDAAGTITTVAGNGINGSGGDGGPATSAGINAPNAAVMTASGDILIADSNNNKIRKVSPDGTITTVAGTGAAGFGGDGGPATAALLSFPADVAVTADGGYLIADNDNNRIRKVSAAGTITTVAGTGVAGFSGDAGPATAATINDPAGVAAEADGSFAIDDLNNNRVRFVSPAGTISTIAGTGAAGFGGDGGPGTLAALNQPARVAVSATGEVYVADRVNNRVRRIATDGTITTVAGVGSASFSGDGGAATAAEINGPFGMTVLTDGDLAVADTFNQRVRVVDLNGDTPPPSLTPTSPTPTSSTPTSPALPPPVEGRNVDVVRVSGTVLIRVPPSRKFVPLDPAGVQLPVGAEVDTTKGRVRIVAATAPTGLATETADFYGGIFKVTQPASGKGRVDVTLTGALGHCSKFTSRSAGGAKTKKGKAKPGPKSRFVWGDGHGQFRTVGQRGSAAVRGTKWQVQDRCDGSTLVTVARGIVAVADSLKHKTVLVRAGHSYLIRAHR